MKKIIETKCNGMQLLQNFLKNYWLIFQYIYATLFPKYYPLSKKLGVVNKSGCMFCYKEGCDSRKLTTLIEDKAVSKEVAKLANYKN